MGERKEKTRAAIKTYSYSIREERLAHCVITGMREVWEGDHGVGSADDAVEVPQVRRRFHGRVFRFHIKVDSSKTAFNCLLQNDVNS